MGKLVGAALWPEDKVRRRATAEFCCCRSDDVSDDQADDTINMQLCLRDGLSTAVRRGNRSVL